VLGQLGYQQSIPPFKAQSASVLRTTLKVERNPSVLAALITALGRLRVRSAISWLVPLAMHESHEVRRALAAELPWCTWDSGEERPDRRVTATLIELSRDPAGVVRDWACFSLAGSVADSPKIRAALWDRFRDPHYDTRVEALRGLARRREEGLRQPLRDAIQAIGSDRLGTWVMDDLVDYAKMVRDRQLVEALQS
jgi:HEAT repeat protein